jgi:hypothetical protein
MTTTRLPVHRGFAESIKPYLEAAPLGALLLGISSGFPYAMIGATLTTRLAQSGIDKKSVTAFSLAFLVYNFKFLWAPAWIECTCRCSGVSGSVARGCGCRPQRWRCPWASWAWPVHRPACSQWRSPQS